MIVLLRSKDSRRCPSVRPCASLPLRADAVTFAVASGPLPHSDELTHISPLCLPLPGSPWRRASPKPDQALKPVEHAPVREMEEETRRLRMGKGASGPFTLRGDQLSLLQGSGWTGCN